MPCYSVLLLIILFVWAKVLTPELLLAPERSDCGRPLTRPLHGKRSPWPDATGVLASQVRQRPAIDGHFLPPSITCLLSTISTNPCSTMAWIHTNGPAPPRANIDNPNQHLSSAYIEQPLVDEERAPLFHTHELTSSIHNWRVMWKNY